VTQTGQVRSDPRPRSAQVFDGILPTHRKVLPRGTDNRADSHLDPEPVLIGMEFAGNYTFQ
jgi:hypothetical protein